MAKKVNFRTANMAELTVVYLNKAMKIAEIDPSEISVERENKTIYLVIDENSRFGKWSEAKIIKTFNKLLSLYFDMVRNHI